jgi:Ni/Co efflux regulator RcnB
MKTVLSMLVAVGTLAATEVLAQAPTSPAQSGREFHSPSAPGKASRSPRAQSRGDHRRRCRLRRASCGASLIQRWRLGEYLAGRSAGRRSGTSIAQPRRRSLARLWFRWNLRRYLAGPAPRLVSGFMAPRALPAPGAGTATARALTGCDEVAWARFSHQRRDC